MMDQQTKINVLIVDDCPIMRMIIKRTVHLCGIETGEIIEAGNGKEGLNLLENNKFDLVVVDLNMPIMSGSEMIAHMRTNLKFRTIPVLTVSAESNNVKVDVISNLIDGFVHKPFSVEILRDQMLKVLKKEAIISSTVS